MITFLRWLAFGAYLSILLIYMKGGTSILKDIRESIKSTKSYTGAVLITLMSVVGIALLVLQLLVCLGRSTTYTWAENPWVVALGTFLTTLGITAVYWFRFRYLGRFWSGSVQMQASHEIIKVGPYGIVRHPIYSTALLIYPGMALAFATWWNWLACGLMVLGYVLLTAYEDRFLAVNLSGYREYQQHTRYRLIPGVW